MPPPPIELPPAIQTPLHIQTPPASQSSPPILAPLPTEVPADVGVHPCSVSLHQAIHTTFSPSRWYQDHRTLIHLHSGKSEIRRHCCMNKVHSSLSLRVNKGSWTSVIDSA